MKVANFILALGVLALASSFAIAYDPSPLQDFCVATDDAYSGVFVNGKFCKDPEHVTADDFFYSGLNVASETSKQLGARTNLLTVDSIPGLNTNANGGLNPPHHHPRASEILTVLEGTLYAGFISSNPDHRVFSKVLKAGDVFQNPGVVTTANTVFGASPSLVPDVLTRAFHLDKDLVTKLQKQEWVNPSELDSYSNSY
ncbi:hypothetical protein P3X46_026197 [Hevea brasiliensis]|uniref:Germin-like protein n=1 Tax=Hevea brasiliensis TaxID=3981 RepID=A0ABQ9KY14_HEVBR|nr:hypothetical protein P3X46_026197 [Hevea brasiliensis]